MLESTRKLGEHLSAMQRWLIRQNTVSLFVLFAAAALLHGGFSFSPSIQDVDFSTSVFPQPIEGSESLSYGLRGIYFLLKFNQSTEALIAWTTLLALLALVSILLFKQLGDPVISLLLLSFVFLGPTASTLLSGIGRHDLLTIAGGILVGLSVKRPILLVVGPLLMFAGNPEQSLLGLSCFAAAAWGLGDRKTTRRTIMAICVLLLVFLAMQSYAWKLGVPSRISVYLGLLGESFRVSLVNLPNLLYSGYGLSLIVLVIAIFSVYRSNRFRGVVLIVSLFVIPLLATLSTADQTRVLVCLTTPVVFLVLIWALPPLLSREHHLRDWIVGFTFVVLCALPTTVIWYPGVLVSPWSVFRP